ncbi:MAG TPA: prepilin-type N-terminal cleavage/methylation domain-containing protein [Verrucomicrobiae bacterium]
MNPRLVQREPWNGFRYSPHSLLPRRHAGYSLVEVLCAIAVASIAITALFYGFKNGVAILRTTREDMRATQLLVQKTEAFRLYTWQQLSNAPTKLTEYYFPASVTSSNADTLYYLTISATDPATNIPDTIGYKTNIHLITVTVDWTNYIDKKPVAHRRQMQTLNALNGMQSYLFGGAH